MPRVTLSAEQKRNYKILDLKGWVVKQMKLTGKRQADVAEALNISQPRLSKMLKVPDGKQPGGKKENFDVFSYGQLLAMCDLFEVPAEERQKLLVP